MRKLALYTKCGQFNLAAYHAPAVCGSTGNTAPVDNNGFSSVDEQMTELPYGRVGMLLLKVPALSLPKPPEARRYCEISQLKVSQQIRTDCRFLTQPSLSG